MAAAVVKRFAETVSCFTFNADKSKLALCPNNTEIHIYAKKGAEWVEEVVLTEVSDARVEQWRRRHCARRLWRRSLARDGLSSRVAVVVSRPTQPRACRRSRAREHAGFFLSIRRLSPPMAAAACVHYSLCTSGH